MLTLSSFSHPVAFHSKLNYCILLFIIIITIINISCSNYDNNNDNNNISVRWPDLVIVNNKKRTCWIVDFAIPTDHRIKLNESQKRDEYLDLSREQKKKWNMKVMAIPVVISTLSTVTKGLVHKLEDLEIWG